MTYFLSSSKLVSNGSLVLGVVQVVCIPLTLIIAVMLVELGVFIIALYYPVNS